MTPARRIGFSVTASVEYRPDFVIAGDDVYIWAKVNRIVDGPHFQTGYIENPVIDLMGNVPPFGSMANFLGNQAVTSTLTQGFTVIHGDHGDDFSLGLLFPPQRPNHPFTVQSSERFTFANETTDVQPAERDFLGPFEVVKDGQALFFSTTVQGPAVNLVVVSKATGDVWRDMYQTGKPLGPAARARALRATPSCRARSTRAATTFHRASITSSSTTPGPPRLPGRLPRAPQPAQPPRPRRRRAGAGELRRPALELNAGAFPVRQDVA